MTGELENQRDKIIDNLEILNKEVAKQNSLKAMFVRGIVSGIGFVVGSAVIATIAIGVLGPLVGQIPWVHDKFETGSQLINQ
jgi:hypothetical protein